MGARIAAHFANAGVPALLLDIVIPGEADRNAAARRGIESAFAAERVIVEIELDEDEIRRLIDAVDHYEAYLHSRQWDEGKFRELLVRLRKLLGQRS